MGISMTTEDSAEGPGFELSRIRQEGFRQYSNVREFVSLDDETVDRVARRMSELQIENVTPENNRSSVEAGTVVNIDEAVLDRLADRICKRVLQAVYSSSAIMDDTLSTPEAMKLLKYTGRSDRFLQTVRSQGIPHTRVNARHFVFNRTLLRSWMERRNPVKGL